jgi:hypothetical protein
VENNAVRSKRTMHGVINKLCAIIILKVLTEKLNRVRARAIKSTMC